MEKFWRILPRLNNATRKYLLIQSHKLGGMKGRFSLLDYVYLNDGCIQRNICDEFSLDPPSVSSYLSTLEKEEMLQRKRNSQSTREVNVFITEKGRRTQDQLKEVYDEMENIIFSGFSAEEQTQCLEYMTKMYNNIILHLSQNKK